MRFAKGWMRSRRPAKYAFSPASPVVAPRIDLVRYMPPVFNQGPVGSCFGHGLASAIAGSFAAGGRPLDWTPSPSSIYRLTRAVTRSRRRLDPASHPLTDTGSYPVDGFEAVEKFGVKPMDAMSSGRFTDCWGEAVNAEPVQSELEEDAEHLVLGQEVTLWGSNGPGNARAANTLLRPVAFGIFVDEAFERWNPSNGFLGAPQDPYDPEGGGHYVCAVGFTRAGLLAQDVRAALPERLRSLSSEHERAIGQAAAVLPSDEAVNFGLNSWGNWGLRGFFLFTDELYRDVQTGDGYAVEARWR